MSLLLLTGAAGVFVGAGGVPGLGRVRRDDGRARARLRRCVGAQPLPRPRHRQADGLAHASSGRSPRDACPRSGRSSSASRSRRSRSCCSTRSSTSPTALLALAGNLFYVLVYTRWLKRSTPQNIVIGGAAGAVPPLVGYAGAAGHLGFAALVMFAIVFVWTPPHFWALALMIKEHYARANVPMLPVARGDSETAQADRALHGPADRGHARAGRARHVRARLRRLGVRAGRALPLARGRAAPDDWSAATRCGSSTSRSSISRCSSSRWPSTR